ncbi:hypothetical protein BKA70DRAFT_1343675 [Coprinopsis sp. MPI-PUGE-AT-0042]|nr:hypothetical protein BKA70DRAFT_1343675 [Coprinopsis sp. MPI-PUGE-AT-0042]
MHPVDVSFVFPASIAGARTQQHNLKIPSEIISLILRGLFVVFAGKEDREDLLTASMVSRTWRAISLGTPELWTGLSFTYNESNVSSAHETLSRWFDRAGEALPLHLELKGYYFNWKDSELDSAVKEIITWTSKRGSRWGSLRTPFPLHLLFLEIDPPGWTNLSFLSTSRRPIPNSRVHVGGTYNPHANPGHDVATCKQVQSLDISEHVLFSKPLATIFPNVSALQIQYEYFSAPSAHALALSKFKHLTHLKFIESVGFPNLPHDANSQPSILYQLQSLDLRVRASNGRTDNLLLACLTCPSLCTLTLSMENPTHQFQYRQHQGPHGPRAVDVDTALLNIIISFQERSSMKLTHLSLTGLGVADFVYRKLIERNTSILAIELDRWPYLEVVGDFTHLLPLISRMSIIPHTLTGHKKHSLLSFLSGKSGLADGGHLPDERRYPGAEKVMDRFLRIREAPRVKIKLGKDREWGPV